MRKQIPRFLAMCFAAFCLICGAYAQSRASISGQITNRAVDGLRVLLKPVLKNPLARYDGYEARLTNNGGFIFEDVDPGKYLLVTQAEQFMPMEFGAAQPRASGTPIELRPGQHLKNISITLVRKHVICGKVTDEKGAPVPKIEIYAFAHRPGTSWLSFDDDYNMRTIADDNGNYRLPDLQPGEYYVQAGMYAWYSTAFGLTEAERENFATATPIIVGPDNNTQCVENIPTGERLGYQGYHVRGRIADDPNLKDEHIVLSLLEVSHAGAMVPLVGVGEALNPGPTFDFWGVPTGIYRLVLSNGRFPQMWEGPAPEYHELSSQQIVVKDDVNGITVQADPLASISGHVTLQGVTAAGICPTQEKLHLGIRRDEDGEFQQTELGDDSNFSFSQLKPGSYSVRLYPTLRTTTYLKSMEFDGKEVEGRSIQIASAAPHSLNVVISGDEGNAAGHSRPDVPWERYEEAWAHPKASVSGKVSNLTPNTGLRVKLWSVRYNSDHSYEYSTEPAADGSFHFDNIDPGIYFLLTQGPNYVISEYGATKSGLEGTAITLTAGQHLDRIVLKAQPRAASLCGKVTDENGKPVENTIAFAWNEANPLATEATRAITAGDGSFRFDNLPPGRYILWADPAALPEGKVSAENITYFPASVNLDQAQSISVAFDTDNGCRHNIQLQTSPRFHIRGKVPQEITHAPDEVFSLNLIAIRGGRIVSWVQSKSEVEGGGEFDFTDIQPGHYVIQLSMPAKRSLPGEVHTFSGPMCGFESDWTYTVTQKVEVSNHDVDVSALDLNSVVSVNGTVRLEDIPAELKDYKVSNLILNTERSFCTPSTQLDAQNNFSLHGIEEGTYLVNLPLTGSLYVKSILLDGRSVEGKHVTLTTGKPTHLEIVVSGNGGEVDATIQRKVPLENYRYDEPCGLKIQVGPYAYLIPDPLPADVSGVTPAFPTTDGFLEIPGIAPGKYHLVAGENFSMSGGFPTADSLWKQPKFLQAVAALGQAVDVAPRQKVKISVAAATAEIQNLSATQSQPIHIEDHCAIACSYEKFWEGDKSANLQH